MLTWVRWLDASLPRLPFVHDSTYGFSVLLTVHVVAIAVFLGLVVMMDVRLVGVGHRRTSPGVMQSSLFGFYVGAFLVVLLSGVVMVWSNPLRYYGKTFFWWKMAAIVAAGVNAGLVHRRARRSDAGWDSRDARRAGAVSLGLWAVVLALGRLTAFEWLTTEYR